MTCPGRQLGMNGSAAPKEHPEDMAAQRAARGSNCAPGDGWK